MMTAPQDPQWYIARDGQRIGPINDAEFRTMAADGRLGELDYVWKQGYGDWVLAKNVPGLLNKPSATVSSSADTSEVSSASSATNPLSAVIETNRTAKEPSFENVDWSDNQSAATPQSSPQAQEKTAQNLDKAAFRDQRFEALPQPTQSGQQQLSNPGFAGNVQPQQQAAVNPAAHGTGVQGQNTGMPIQGQAAHGQPFGQAPQQGHPGQAGYNPQQGQYPAAPHQQQQLHSPAHLDPAFHHPSADPQFGGTGPGHFDVQHSGQPAGGQYEPSLGGQGQPQQLGYAPQGTAPHDFGAHPNAPVEADPFGQPTFAGDPHNQDQYHPTDPNDPFGNDMDFRSNIPYANQKRGGSMLRNIGFALAMIVFLCVMAIVAIPFVIPADAIKDQIVSLIKERTGRDVIVRGRASVAFFPSLGVQLNDITIANPTGMAGEPLLRMAALTVDLKPLPLLSQELQIERFVLKSPRLSLSVDQNGRKNWTFNKAGGRVQTGSNAPQIFGDAFSGDETLIRQTLHETFPTSLESKRDETSGSLTTRDVQLAQSPLPAPPNRSFTPKSSSSSSSSAMIKNLSIGDMRIIDGTFSYVDLRSNTRHEVKDIGVAVDYKSPSSPLNIDGSAVWRDEKLKIVADIATPQALLEQGFSPMKLTLNSAPLNADFRGQLTNSETPVLLGSLSGEAPTLNALLNWTSGNISVKGGAEKMTISSEISATVEKITLEKTQVRHAGSTAAGKAIIDLSADKPFITSALTIDHLNLNKLIPAKGSNSPRPAAAPPAATPSAGASQNNGDNSLARDDTAIPTPEPSPKNAEAAEPSSEPQSLTDLINSMDEEGSLPSNRYRPYNAPENASSGQSAFPYKNLALANAAVDLRAGKITYKKITVGQSTARVEIKNGQLLAKVNKAQLYGGVATANLLLDGRVPGGPFKSSLNAEKVSALPFLRDSTDFDWVSGTASIRAEFSGSGARHEDIVKRLNGSGAVTFSNGAVEGLDIPGMIGDLQKGKISGLQRSSNKKTEFNALTGTFVVDNGVASNSDLTLVSPYLTMSGQGKVSLPEETIDYHVEPKVKSDPKSKTVALAIPLHVSGPWKQPRIVPDAKKILKDPKTIERGVKEIGKLLKKKKVKTKDFQAVINNVLQPSKPATKPKPAAAPSRNNSGDNTAIETNKLLKQLLGQ